MTNENPNTPDTDQGDSGPVLQRATMSVVSAREFLGCFNHNTLTVLQAALDQMFADGSSKDADRRVAERDSVPEYYDDDFEPEIID